MIDTGNVKGGYCSKQEMIYYLKVCEEVKRLRYDIEQWKWELQKRMCPIEFDALVNGGEEE